jgi:hypothetical protein
MSDEKYTHYIYDAPKGSPTEKRIYFKSYGEAWKYVMEHQPAGGVKGIYHIYPVDNSGYTSKSDGRKSFGEGNKDWERKNKKN